MSKKEKPKKTVKLRSKIKKKTVKKPPANSRFFKFTGDDGKKYSLTTLQKLFVECYLEFGANGTNAVIEAGYDVQFKKNGKPTGGVNRNLASVISSENLLKPNICAYIAIKLEEYGFNDDNIEKQHLFLVNQHANLPTKQRAISDYYKLKGKYAPEEKKIKHELTQELLDRIIKG